MSTRNQNKSLHVHALGELLTSGPFHARVRGHCMAPTINDESSIEVIPGAPLRCGDVLVWRNADGQISCHRYLGRFPGRRGLGFVSWGDNVARPDRLLQLDDILGKVAAVDAIPFHIPLRHRIASAKRYLRYIAFRILRLLV